MSGGSVYDYLHKQKGAFKLPSLLKVAIDVSKGMNYLHQNNIIHRDLKAANLLMDENEVWLPFSKSWIICIIFVLCQSNKVYSMKFNISMSSCLACCVFSYFPFSTFVVEAESKLIVLSYPPGCQGCWFWSG